MPLGLGYYVLCMDAVDGVSGEIGGLGIDTTATDDDPPSAETRLGLFSLGVVLITVVGMWSNAAEANPVESLPRTEFAVS